MGIYIYVYIYPDTSVFASVSAPAYVDVFAEHGFVSFDMCSWYDVQFAHPQRYGRRPAYHRQWQFLLVHGVYKFVHNWHHCWVLWYTWYYSGWWYTHPSAKYKSQIGSSSQLLGKIKHVLNHQSVFFMGFIKPKFTSLGVTTSLRKHHPIRNPPQPSALPLPLGELLVLLLRRRCSTSSCMRWVGTMW